MIASLRNSVATISKTAWTTLTKKIAVANRMSGGARTQTSAFLRLTSATITMTAITTRMKIKQFAVIFFLEKRQQVHSPHIYICLEKHLVITADWVCPDGRWTCKNNKCIHESDVCDTNNDCNDNSDEHQNVCGDFFS